MQQIRRQRSSVLAGDCCHVLVTAAGLLAPASPRAAYGPRPPRAPETHPLVRPKRHHVLHEVGRRATGPALLPTALRYHVRSRPRWDLSCPTLPAIAAAITTWPAVAIMPP